MATIRTGLAMHDQMTGVLKNITSSLNLTLSAMDKVQQSMDRTFDPRAIDAARAAVRQTEAALKDIKPPIEDADDATTGLIGNLGKVAALVAPFLAVGKVLRGGFDRLVGIDTATAKLQALGHSGEAVETIMGNAISSVTGTAFRMEDAANTAASAVAAGIKPGQQLERYLSLTADAAAIAGTGMDEMGAIFNKVTTSGMIQAQELNQIADRGIPIFQMLADQMGVTAQDVRALASEGQISSDIFLNAVESGFGGAAQAMGTASLQATIDNIGAAISRIGASFLNGANDGQGFFEQIKPLAVDLLNALRSMESGAAAVGNAFGAVFMFIRDNWSLIGSIIWGIITAMGAWYVATNRQAIITGVMAVKQGIMTAATYAQTVATIGLRAAWQSLNATMRANIIILIISLIVGLIAVFFRLWRTNDKFAAGFMRTWNSILNFFDRIPAYFWSFVEMMATPFEWWAKSVGKIYDTVINGIIAGIKKVLDIVNKVTGSSYEIAAEFSFENVAKGMREYAQVQKEIANSNALMKAGEREQRVLDMLDTRAAKRAREEEEKAADAANAEFMSRGEIDHIAKVDEVGKIRDTVDISSEDLKLMRELAEVNAIQNFVTLQPQMSFGDTHVRQDGRTVDELVADITERLNDEIASSAKQVFNV